jgi:hypothetical protein
MTSRIAHGVGADRLARTSYAAKRPLRPKPTELCGTHDRRAFRGQAGHAGTLREAIALTYVEMTGGGLNDTLAGIRRSFAS